MTWPKMIDKHRFKKLLRELRNEAGRRMTLKDVAVALGKSPRHVYGCLDNEQQRRLTDGDWEIIAEFGIDRVEVDGDPCALAWSYSYWSMKR